MAGRMSGSGQGAEEDAQGISTAYSLGLHRLPERVGADIVRTAHEMRGAVVLSGYPCRYATLSHYRDNLA